MTRPRSRWPNGSMSNCLQPSPHGAEIETQAHPDNDSSSPEENNNITGQPPLKKKRGLAKPYIDWCTDKKLVVELNSHCQPIGKNASKLASQLGVIARYSIYCPIIYTDWRCKELDSFKERIWKDVKDNCEVSDDYKETCLMSVGDKLRKWRARLKKEYYSIYDNDEDRLANVPKRVAPDQWKLFVQFQSSEMAKERSETNRDNQKQKVMTHTSGRKSHQVVREEMIAKGEKGDRIDVYIATHMKGGKPVDEEAVKAIDAINAKLQEVPEAERTLEFREKVFTDVFGPDTHGFVRTFGKGPSPTDVFGKKNTKSHEKQFLDFEKMREEAREEGRKEGREKGMEEGRKRGLEEGRVVGIQEGRQEYRDMMGHVKEGRDQQISDANSSHHESDDVDSSEFLFDVGMKVDLLSVHLPKRVVAIGRIVSMDPKKKLGGTPIGDGFWEVQITKAILPSENLLIGRGKMRKVRHAIGQNVPWRKVDIKEQ